MKKKSQLFKSHSGDCTIYRALLNGNPEDGICTCGYGWELVRKGDRSEMYSEERRAVNYLYQPKTKKAHKPNQKVYRIARTKRVYHPI